MTVISTFKFYYCIVNLGLITWLGATAVGVFYKGLVYSYARIPLDSKISAAQYEAVQECPAPHPVSYYQTIVERDLFKTRQNQKAESRDPDDAARLETAQLGVKLWGTVSGNDSPRFAVIEVKDGTNKRRQHLYREGDTIETATIEKILRDKVVVRLDGQRKVLLLEAYISQSRRKPFSRAASSKSRTYRRSIRRATIERAVSNVGQLMTQAKMVPHKDGLAITAIKPGSLFRRLGLRNGDVIEGVNGRNIQSVEDALSFYGRLRNDTSVTVDIMRRGRKRTLQYLIR